jgi:hypothetical protein
MRIVIETDPQSDNVRSITTDASAEAITILEGGPAPAMLLRQFGRVPPAETFEDESGGQAPESRDHPLNPLRSGAAAAREYLTGEGHAEDVSDEGNVSE